MHALERNPVTTTETLRPIDAQELQRARTLLARIAQEYSSRVVGQAELRDTLLTGLLTGGHVLLESVPGLAKTTAAQTLAEAVDGSFRRIQCTPDLLPSDIVGTQIYDQSQGKFITQLGPVHANFVLLDEINRSSAKTQSAMLEAMQEKQTTIGGTLYPLPKPFLVLATQNPIEQEGTYVLPEAQLDRFLLKAVLDYPQFDEEIEILRRIDAGLLDASSKPRAVASVDDVLALQDIARRVYIDPAIVNYIASIVFVTRRAGQYIGDRLASFIETGASPRASIAFVKAARARALIQGRDHVIPDDIKALRYQVLRHRILLTFEAAAEDVRVETIIDAVVNSVRVP